MAELTRFCPACYEPNPASLEFCRRCGARLESEETFDERLVWALRHPDTAVAVLAAELLAARKARQAIPALLELSESSDPYRAAAATAALGAFRGDPTVAAALGRLAEAPSFLVRNVARAALAEPDATGSGGERATDPRVDATNPAGAEPTTDPLSGPAAVASPSPGAPWSRRVGGSRRGAGRPDPLRRTR